MAGPWIQDQPEVKLTWRARDDFETAEGHHEMGHDGPLLEDAIITITITYCY